MKKIYLYCCFAFALVASAMAQTIPADRRVEWSYAGINQAPPVFEQFIKVDTVGIVADGVTDNTQVLNALIAAAITPTVLIFDAGDYYFTGTIALKSNVVLRGNCSNNTRLLFNFNGNGYDGVSMSSGQNSSFIAMLSGYTQGATQVTVADASGFAIGDYAEIREQNGNWDTQPATWAVYSVGQIVRIAAIDGQTLTLEHPLRTTYEASLNPEIRKITPIQFAGIENFYIARTDAVATPSGGNNILFNFAANCWAYGIESNKSASAHVAFFNSTNCELKGSYLHHAFEYTGSNTKGYGAMVAQHAGECLIENNIFEHLRHSMSLKQGANGNVYAYNYSLDPNRSEFISDYGADISIHGHYPFANLLEGNIVEFLQIDYTWGPAGPHNTYFRNRINHYGIVMSATAIGGTGSNRQNFVGNEITNNGFCIPPCGSYNLTGSDHFEYGNNRFGNAVPSGTSDLTSISYYLNTDIPLFWTFNNRLPANGFPNTLNQYVNPAQLRYDNALRTYSPTASCCPDLEIWGSVHNDLCETQAATYYTLPVDSAAFTWTVVGGTIISGQGSSQIQVQWNNNANGSVQLARD